jgi:hypothetical protein
MQKCDIQFERLTLDKYEKIGIVWQVRHASKQPRRILLATHVSARNILIAAKEIIFFGFLRFPIPVLITEKKSEILHINIYLFLNTPPF